MEGDEPRKSAKSPELGADLSNLSVAELEERLAALKAEITRTEAAIAAKRQSAAAAHSIFKL